MFHDSKCHFINYLFIRPPIVKCTIYVYVSDMSQHTECKVPLLVLGISHLWIGDKPPPC